jgi:hypothetical protein
MKLIKSRVTNYKAKSRKRADQRRQRFLELVKIHGLEKVAVAADLSVSTIDQYRRPSAAESISHKLMVQLETILQEK